MKTKISNFHGDMVFFLNVISIISRAIAIL